MSWNIDSAHTHATVKARHMMISTVSGTFDKISGTVDFNEDDPEKSSVDIKIDAASIDTKDERRDAHLKSPDFLDAGAYPYIQFKSKRVEKIDDNHGKIIGDLTIRDVTKEVPLDVEYVGKAKSPWGTWSAGFYAATKINRKDWGLNWNVALETGGWLVGDTITIEIDAEIIQQPQEQPAAEKATA
jgi:polyisoprenoid-binding protein YceI